MDAQTKLSKAKTSLILDHPFFGTLALNMPSHVQPKSWFTDKGLPPTAAVSYDDMHFCEDFLNDLSDDEVKFLVAHEVMHPALDHLNRLHGRNARLWNKAGDYVINQHLVDAKVGKMPKDGLYDPTLYNQFDGVTDNIYAALNNEGEGEGGEQNDGMPMDTMIEGDSDGTSPAEREAKANEWKVKVVQAAQAAKMTGNLPAGIARLVDDLVEAKVRWQDVLYNFLVRSREDNRSYSRPNRRFLWHDLILPSVSGESLGEMVFAIDCSGSVGQAEMNQFAAELNYVKQELRPSKVHVIYFDSEVSHYESYERDDVLDIRPHGGGGTAFSPVFEFIRSKSIEPLACVFLTDLYCYDFGEAPHYPVLWVSNGDSTAPFGEVVMM